MAESTKKPNDKNPGDHGHAHDVNPGVSHERRDINVFQVSAFGIGLLLGCIVTVFVIWGLFDFLYSREDAKNAANPAALMMKDQNKLPPEPRLQANPKVELKDLRSDEDAILNSYGWVDQKAGIVRLPIDRAIELTVRDLAKK